MSYYFKGYTQEEKEQIRNNILEQLKKMNEEEVIDLVYEYRENMEKYDKQYNYYSKKSEENGYGTVGKEWTELMKIKEKTYEEYCVVYNYYFDNF